MPLSIVAIAVLSLFLSTQAPHVVDGDTLSIEGQEVHLRGIDAPELHQSCRRSDGSAFFCGQEAARALAAIVANGITCEPADHNSLVTCRDQDDGDIALHLVRSGLVTANEADGEYRVAEHQARIQRIGIWEGSFLHPRIWRERTSANPPILIEGTDR